MNIIIGITMICNVILTSLAQYAYPPAYPYPIPQAGQGKPVQIHKHSSHLSKFSKVPYQQSGFSSMAYPFQYQAKEMVKEHNHGRQKEPHTPIQNQKPSNDYISKFSNLPYQQSEFSPMTYPYQYQAKQMVNEHKYGSYRVSQTGHQKPVQIHKHSGGHLQKLSNLPYQQSGLPPMTYPFQYQPKQTLKEPKHGRHKDHGYSASDSFEHFGSCEHKKYSKKNPGILTPAFSLANTKEKDFYENIFQDDFARPQWIH